MMPRFIIVYCTYLIFPFMVIGQAPTITGNILTEDGPASYALVMISNLSIATTADSEGRFELENVPRGSYNISIRLLGYEDYNQNVEINGPNQEIQLNIQLTNTYLDFDEIVVTGTKTFKRKTKAAIIVHVVNKKKLDNIQACNLSEGLRFLPGIRVETDCQTCNYTQLRMNGLSGGYSQILINGRPIFSPLTGLYGLEQLPANMIDRIEVVRGGGSSLYGSSAIGGTVNILTSIPQKSAFELSYNYQSIKKSTDHIFTGNGSYVNNQKTGGISFFVNDRTRAYYDHDGDNFSEIPAINNTSIGTNAFYQINDNQKIEFSLSKIHEYRYGGEMIRNTSHLNLQAEERTHNVWMASADYSIRFNENQSSINSYFAYQNTARDHYTGIFPDEPEDIAQHLSEPPYGISNARTVQGGIQLNHSLPDMLLGKNVITFGLEYIYDDTYDEIEAYNYLIDQTTKNIGSFIQSDWKLSSRLNLLSGIRLDQHNLTEGLIYSPRASLLYNYKANTQIRVGFGTGFRAPQAFDTDLHIAFAGGGISRVNLSEDLSKEQSKNINISINSDKATEKYIVGYTLEGFYTRLNDVFILDPVGEDAFGEVFLKKNGQGAKVYGTTLELRANFDQKIQIETGWTFQKSYFDNPVSYIDDQTPIREYIRTPDSYGFLTMNIKPNSKWDCNLNYIYTGSMIIPHFGGATNQIQDEITQSPSFSEIHLKLSYKPTIYGLNERITIFGGIKNMTNAYQNDFDKGKNRDSNYVYGPSQPRSIFVGLTLKSW